MSLYLHTPRTLSALFHAAAIGIGTGSGIEVPGLNQADRATPPVPLVPTLPPSDLEEEDADDTKPFIRRGEEWVPVVKTCSCGQRYDAAGWKALPRCGLQTDGRGGVLELRTCPCGSTCGVPYLSAPSDYHRLPKTDAPPAL